jgi:hypothetical protein
MSTRHRLTVVGVALSLVASTFGGFPHLADASPAPAGSSATTDVGGAGAFIPPAHANGVFGAGGPMAGIGAAGAFLPFTPTSS